MFSSHRPIQLGPLAGVWRSAGVCGSSFRSVLRGRERIIANCEMSEKSSFWLQGWATDRKFCQKTRAPMVWARFSKREEKEGRRRRSVKQGLWQVENELRGGEESERHFQQSGYLSATKRRSAWRHASDETGRKSSRAPAPTRKRFLNDWDTVLAMTAENCRVMKIHDTARIWISAYKRSLCKKTHQCESDPAWRVRWSVVFCRVFCLRFVNDVSVDPAGAQLPVLLCHSVFGFGVAASTSSTLVVLFSGWLQVQCFARLVVCSKWTSRQFACLCSMWCLFAIFDNLCSKLCSNWRTSKQVTRYALQEYEIVQNSQIEKKQAHSSQIAVILETVSSSSRLLLYAEFVRHFQFSPRLAPMNVTLQRRFLYFSDCSSPQKTNPWLKDCLVKVY